MTVNIEQKETEHFEEWLNFGLENYHISWRESWGKTISSGELRDAIGETPRLVLRIQEHILEEVQSKVIGNRPDSDIFLFSDVNLITNFINQAGKKFSNQVGLIWHAKTIREFLSGEDSHLLMEILGADTIRKALAYQEVSPQPDTYFKVEDIKKHIEEDGLVCCLNWVKQFPDYAAARLAVLLPKPNDDLVIQEHIDEDKIRVVNLILNPEK